MGLVHRPVAERAEHDASLLQTVEPGLMIEYLAARYYHSYVEVIGGRRCASSALPRHRAAKAAPTTAKGLGFQCL
jgi:hypothetical protein